MILTFIFLVLDGMTANWRLQAAIVSEFIINELKDIDELLSNIVIIHIENSSEKILKVSFFYSNIYTAKLENYNKLRNNTRLLLNAVCTHKSNNY